MAEPYCDYCREQFNSGWLGHKPISHARTCPGRDRHLICASCGSGRQTCPVCKEYFR
jgi:hypothetical protein